MDCSYSKISFEQAHEMVEQHIGAMIIDVRSEEEYITGHAEGAVLFPLDTISADNARQLIPSLDTPVLLYCRSGRRSNQAAEQLSALGYTKVYDMGSLVGWPYGMEW
jgi:rhodanese-related sulfurtransferase